MSAVALAGLGGRVLHATGSARWCAPWSTCSPARRCSPHVGHLVAMTFNIAINPNFPHPLRYGLLNAP
ncbi:hypothetical protein ACSHWB_33715 [Lentzea sp. HUAS TT2]|uniref:hypothetical protein n=1 Tax=Lentzea sp. HUAS TT2 TaxID=3447454 RepID=UPI003F711DE9